MELTYLETHQDLSPASPQVITGSFVIDCTDITARYKINPDIPHAFLVRTAADITVKDASGNALTKDSDFYLRQTKRDAYYSKEYSLSSIFSEIQFAAVGSYTVTRHLCVGTYVTASWLNAVKLAIKDILASIQSIMTTLSSHTTTLDNHATTLSDHNASLSDHASRITVLESNPTIIVVADHATMIALTGLKTGTTVYVASDTDGKRAEYLYDGTSFQKTSDPDWENINLDWSALLNIPTGVAALIAGTLKSTALADMPTPADADDTKVLAWDKDTGKYELTTVAAAAGVGDVSGPASSTDGNFAIMSGTTGKVIAASEYNASSFILSSTAANLYASACASQEVSTTDVTITDNKDGTLILSGALTGCRFVYLPAAVWRKVVICRCTGTGFVSIRTVGQQSGVTLYPGEVANVYCDGAVVKRVPARLAELYVGMHATAPENVLLFNGSTKARTAYPELWAMISASRLPSVLDTEWLAGSVGAFSTGDGSTTFRLPDWRGLFPRMAGINSVLAKANATKYTGGSLAEVMLDMMQGHRHSLSISDYAAVSVYSYGRGSPLSAVSTDAVGSPISDGTNGTPRVGAETRPVSVAFEFGIYFE